MGIENSEEFKRHIAIIGYAGDGVPKGVLKLREQFLRMASKMEEEEIKANAEFKEMLQKAMGVIDADIISKFEKLGLTPEQMWYIQRIIQPERPKLEELDFLLEPKKEKKKGYQKKNRFWER